MMKKVVSLLLALVMALGLCVNAIAEPAGGSNEPSQEPEQTPPSTYTMDMVLAGVDNLDGTDEAKEAAKTYLRQYFCMNGDGRFFVMNHISFWGDRFYETTSEKEQARSVIAAYEPFRSMLDSLPIPYGGRNDMTLGNLMGFYHNALEYPVIKIHDRDEWGSNGPDTGDVFSVDALDVTEANKAYIGPYDVDEARNYFNKYFVLKQLGDDTHDLRVDFKDEYYKDGELDTEQARAAIRKYYNELPAGAVVLLNELSIHMPIPNGMECYRFWRVIELFDRQLNGGGPGGGPDNGDGGSNLAM